MSDKTHYRKAFNSPYLSSADIVAPTAFTISKVTLEKHKANQSKGELFNTAYFTDKFLRDGEPLKPMILNAHNCKVLRELAGSYYIEDWAGTSITIYVDANVRFGSDTVEGLRISTEQPKAKPELTPKSNNWGMAIDAYKRDKNLDKVLARATVSQANQKLIIEQANAS